MSRKKVKNKPKEWRRILRKAGLTEDPFTAELMLLEKYAKPDPEILIAIHRLKQFNLFEAFGTNPKYGRSV